MNKKILMPIALVFLVGIITFVIAETSEGELDPAGLDGSITLEKGWNLVTHYGLGGRVFDIESEADEKSVRDMGIRAIFSYDPYNKEYIRLFPNRETDKISDYISRIDWEAGADRKDYAAFTNSAAWIYSDKKQTISFHTIDGPFYLNYVNLKSGWNFLAITPEMTGKQLGEIAGSCDIEKAYGWWVERQTWDLIALDGGKFNDEIDMTWRGIVIKVSSDCTLGTSGEGISPPGLPGDSVTCTDTDGGLDYYVKGTVTGQNEDAPVKEITSATDTCDGNKLYELICKNSEEYDDEAYICPNGCQDGACIQ